MAEPRIRNNDKASTESCWRWPLRRQ
jgi:hypothetical protein